MVKITFETYKSEIKTAYEGKKINDVTGVLSTLTPAELRDLCLSLFNLGLSINDERIVRSFLGINVEEDLHKKIIHCEIALFRPIRSFLKGEKNTENRTRIEMAAILIDFDSRPYKKFYSSCNEKESKELEVSFIPKENKVFEEVNENNRVINDKIKIKNIQKRLTLIAIPLLFFGTIGYEVKQNFFNNKECLVWTKDHYEAFEYINVKDTADVIPFNQVLLEDFKKVSVSNATVFFKNGDTNKPIIWYSKNKVTKELDYFNQPGLHPVTRKTLKPITKYIIDKYVLKE
jgi:hypothetical protein